MSIRADLRDDTVAALKAAAIPGIVNNVFPGAALNSIDPDTLPRVQVTTPATIAESLHVGSRELVRETEVQVMILHRYDGNTLEDDLDYYADRVEAALIDPPTSGLIAWNLSAEDTDVRAEGDTLHGEHTLTYKTLYKTAEGDHDTIS